MRLALLAVLPLTGAIPRHQPGKRAENPEPTAKFKVTILADSNRDGKVDVTGETDNFAGKEAWTPESGALFLANIVDTDRRCSSQITGVCANKLGDLFLGTEPKRPDLDPNIQDKLPFGPLYLKDEELEALSESEKAQFSEWKKKYEQYQKALQANEKAAKRPVDEKISECHDSSDDVLRNSTYLAPLRTTPSPGLSDSAIGSITVAEETAAAVSKVRLFHKTGDQWTFIGLDYTFKAQDLRSGLELGIDARDVRRPEWDGRVVVEFNVKDEGKEAKDSVALRVAPVLTQHHGQPAKQLLTTSLYAGPNPTLAGEGIVRSQQRFIKDLEDMSNVAGLKEPLHVFNTSGCSGGGNELWVQDFFEPSYMSIPGPNGPVSLHIMLRSAQLGRGAGRKIFQDLRSNTVGAVQHLANGRTTDATGNLETVPPYTHNGKSYPAGRAIMGSQNGKKPYMVTFLEAQETQAPIELDTSWLYVAHVDEFLQFLPVESQRGWVLAVNDPLAGLEILQKAQQDGHGKDMAVSRPETPIDMRHRVTNTIDDVLNFPSFSSLQQACAKAIEKNIDILKQETGISDAEIIRIPSLFQEYTNQIWNYAPEASGNKQRRQNPDRVLGQEIGEFTEQERQEQAADTSQQDIGSLFLDAFEASTPPKDVTARSLNGRQEQAIHDAVALYPATINSVVLGDKQILAANPWGPVINGQDILAAAVKAAYAKANYTVSYMDDWYPHHHSIGDVHCGSNVIREITSAKWW